jgi:hypothetical protein
VPANRKAQSGRFARFNFDARADQFGERNGAIKLAFQSLRHINRLRPNARFVICVNEAKPPRAYINDQFGATGCGWGWGVMGKRGPILMPPACVMRIAFLAQPRGIRIVSVDAATR